MFPGLAATHKVNYPVGQKGSADIPTATHELYERPNGTGLPKRLKNPKITNLLNEILSEKPIAIQPSLPVPTVTDVWPRTKGDIAGYSDEQVDNYRSEQKEVSLDMVWWWAWLKLCTQSTTYG